MLDSKFKDELSTLPYATMTPEQWDFQKFSALSHQNFLKSNISKNLLAWNKQGGYFSAAFPQLKVFLQVLKLFCKMMILTCQF